jgi:hypothetical protein
MKYEYGGDSRPDTQILGSLAVFRGADVVEESASEAPYWMMAETLVDLVSRF